jgi:hypothetical protein
MRKSPTKGKRMPNSMFGRFCTEFNKMPIGTRYNSKQIREKIPLSLKRNRISSYGMAYTISVFHLMLLATGLIKRVKKRGAFEVLGHIPDFFTYSIGEANRHVTRYRNGKRVKVNGWKLGDPPLVEETKVVQKEDPIEAIVKPKLIILGQIEGCLRTKSINEAVIAMAEGLGPVHILEIMLENRDMIQVSTKGVIDYVEIIKLKDIRIVGEREYRKILYPERDVVVMHDFGPRGLQPDSYKLDSHLAFFKGTDKSIPQKEHSVEVANLVKEAQIVSILKEGLSAVDAAKRIMKLL